MDVVLVNPYPYYASGINESTIYPPLGLAYIASYLEREEIGCEIIDANILQLNNEQVLTRISKNNPKVVGISINVVTAHGGMELSKLVKERIPELTVALGGPFASALPRLALERSNADVVIRGEGELAMLDLVRATETGNVSGIIGPYPLVEDLNSLPIPAYHLLPNLSKYRSRARRRPVAPLLTSRGCPYQCTFCDQRTFGHRFRARSPENVISEINFLVNELGIRQIDVLDDNFTLDAERAERICDLICENNYDILINLQNGIRVDLVTKPLLEKMRKAGVFKIGVGVESGDETILGRIKKNLDLRQVKRVTEWAKELGIMTYGFFILGLPGDTPETMKRTINFAKEMDPDIANFCIAIPLPGTPMYDEIAQKGRFLVSIDEGISTGFYGSKAYFEIDNTQAKDVESYYSKAYREFYLRPRKIWSLIQSTKSLGEILWTLRAIYYNF